MTLHPVYGDDATIRDSLKNKMDIEEKTYTALISGITIVEFENFNEVKNTGNGQAIMLSYIGPESTLFVGNRRIPFRLAVEGTCCQKSKVQRFCRWNTHWP